MKIIVFFRQYLSPLGVAIGFLQIHFQDIINQKCITSNLGEFYEFQQLMNNNCEKT